MSDASENAQQPETAARSSRTSSDLGEDVSRFGYRQELVRSLGSFTSFAVGFSVVSVASGVFGGYGAVLVNGGPAGIWTWPIVAAGQLCVVLVLAVIAGRIPISGMQYSWVCEVAGPKSAWMFGWMNIIGYLIGAVSVNYTFASQAFLPLIGVTPTVHRAQIVTIVVLILQAGVVTISTRLTSVLNAIGVSVELVGIVAISLALLGATLFGHSGTWANLVSRGDAPTSGYHDLNGPLMLTMLLGLYTMVGFESVSGMAEETHTPARTVPKAMVRALVVSALLGMVFLVAITAAIPDITTATQSEAPVAYVVTSALGDTFGKLILALVCVTTFVGGLVLSSASARSTFAMARDKRMVCHRLLAHVPDRTRTPVAASIVVAVAGVAITLSFNTNTLFNLFAATAIPLPLFYLAAIVVVRVYDRRTRASAPPDHFTLGRLDIPITTIAIVWLLFSAQLLMLPTEFRPALKLTLSYTAVGLVIFVYLLATRPDAFRRHVAPRPLQAAEINPENPEGK